MALEEASKTDVGTDSEENSEGAVKGKGKRGANDDLDFDDFDEGSGEWSGLKQA